MHYIAFQHIITYIPQPLLSIHYRRRHRSCRYPIEIESAQNLFPQDDKQENQYVQNFQ